MSSLGNANTAISQIPRVLYVIPSRINRLSFPQKVVVISLAVGVSLIGFLARYLRRRRRIVARRPEEEDISRGMRSPRPIPDTPSRRSTSPSIRSLHRQGSALSDHHLPIPADRLLQEMDDTTPLTSQQLGVMGMEALETALNYWEDALATYHALSGGGDAPLAVTNAEEAQFCRDLQSLVDAAYQLQGQCELLFLDQRSVLFRTDSSARLGGTSSAVTSSPESFVSARDEVADLTDFDEYFEVEVDGYQLYQAAKTQFESPESIPYRTLRTDIVKCGNDAEFLCKLHCIRLAFQYIFKDQQNFRWLADSGREVLASILLFADRDSKDLLIAYENMLIFIKDKAIWSEVEQELSLKGVKAMTFYDVVLDYIILDAFDDLDSPPSSVTAVVNNRWLSNGFKETALTTAVWSLFKAKRRMLKYPDGLISHFYAISEQISPLMAWGFLGPDENLKKMCKFFKDQVIGFLVDIFSFRQCRYTTVEDFSEDILQHLKTRVNIVTQRLLLRINPPSPSASTPPPTPSPPTDLSSQPPPTPPP